MKTFVGIFILLVVFGCGHSKPVPPGPPPVKPPSPVAILTWNRLNGPCVTDYPVYFCWDEGCTPKEAPRGPVSQPPIGVNPTFPIDLTGSVGAAAVTAHWCDNAGESDFSNVIRFDRRQ